MSKKLILLLVVAGALVFSVCGVKKNQEPPKNGNETPGNFEKSPQENGSELIGGQKDEHGCLIAAGYSWCESKQKCLRVWEEDCPGGAGGGACQEEKVTLANYGDPGHRLTNCFVEYPGEPSRQDKSYYIVEDICGQFNQQFIENMLGRKIIRVAPPQVSMLSNCSYYLDDKEYIMLVLNYLKIENQKTGQEALGRKIVKDSKIPMDNYVAYQDDGSINSVYFVLNQEKFISFQRSSKAALDDAQVLDFSAKLGAAIKNYK